jgi:hypothetical protein
LDATWFERAVSPESVCGSLRLHVPEIRSGTVDLLGCRVTRLRASEDGTWTATYLLQVQRADGTTCTVSAHGTLVAEGDRPRPIDDSSGFGEDGWSCWLPELRVHLHSWSADAALPGLHVITHEASARPVLEQLLTAHRPDGTARLVGCQSAVLTYKAGLRATVCCDLDVEPGTSGTASQWPRTVVAKVHRIEDGRACHAVLEALWASPLRSSPSVRIAEPLGYVGELGISVQTYLDHDRTLKDLLAESLATSIDTAAVHDVIRAAAAALAALHTSGVASGPVTWWEEELAALQGKQARL